MATTALSELSQFADDGVLPILVGSRTSRNDSLKGAQELRELRRVTPRNSSVTSPDGESRDAVVGAASLKHASSGPTVCWVTQMTMPSNVRQAPCVRAPPVNRSPRPRSGSRNARFGPSFAAVARRRRNSRVGTIRRRLGKRIPFKATARARCTLPTPPASGLLPGAGRALAGARRSDAAARRGRRRAPPRPVPRSIASGLSRPRVRATRRPAAALPGFAQCSVRPSEEISPHTQPTSF
jgi:hypothetical protein